MLFLCQNTGALSVYMLRVSYASSMELSFPGVRAVLVSLMCNLRQPTSVNAQINFMSHIFGV